MRGLLSLATADRLVGIDATFDFPEAFGNFPAAVAPSVEWAFRNPGIALSPAKVIHVVHVPRSPRVPHAVADGERWWFCKRTSKGTEAMSYEEVRLAFQDTELRRTKLAVLASELEHVLSLADRVTRTVPSQVPSEMNGAPAFRAWATRYPTAVIDSLLGDAWSMLAGRPEIWTTLADLRDELRTSNAVAEAFAHFVHEQATYKQELRQTQHTEMRRSAEAIVKYGRRAKHLVESVLSEQSGARP